MWRIDIDDGGWVSVGWGDTEEEAKQWAGEFKLDTRVVFAPEQAKRLELRRHFRGEE